MPRVFAERIVKPRKKGGTTETVRFTDGSYVKRVLSEDGRVIGRPETKAVAPTQ